MQVSIIIDSYGFESHTTRMIKIKLEMTDAIAFFGNKKKIADICGYTKGSISEWGMGELSQNAAFRLAYISKLPQFRRRGKMNYELIIE